MDSELEILDPQTDEYVDFTQFLTERGLQVTAVDKDHQIETMDGTTYRGRYATKWNLNATCHALNSADTQTVFRILHNEYVTVRYLNPEYGVVTTYMHVDERPAAYRKKRTNDVLWDGISFTLKER